MAPEIRANSQGTGTDESDARLSDDDRFYLLQSSRRRETIRYLLDTDEPAHIRALARHVAAIEHGTSTDALTSEQYQRIYVPLYQLHLPKLEEHGVIEYRKERGLVEPTDALAALRPYLDPNGEDETGPAADASADGKGGDWYIAATGASGLLLAFAAFGILPLSGEALGGVIIAIFLVANAASRRGG